jgi:hypothetical protein
MVVVEIRAVPISISSHARAFLKRQKTLNKSSTITVTSTQTQLAYRNKLALHISCVFLVLSLLVETKRSTASAVVSEIEAELGRPQNDYIGRHYHWWIALFKLTFTHPWTLGSILIE